MTWGAIEIIAAILLLFSVIKLIVLLIISPKAWFKFAKKIYNKPKTTSLIAFILGAIILYYLINSGITIIEIFAVMAFMTMVILIGIAPYGNKLISFFDKKGLKKILREMRFYTLIWVVLIIWAIIELFI